MPVVLDQINKIIEKAEKFSDEERRELIQLLQKQEIEKQGETRKKKSKGKIQKDYVSPNTIWIKEHHAEYAGNHVALFEGELIAVGRTIKEADTKAKEKGYKKTLLHYIPAEDETVWGGW